MAVDQSKFLEAFKSEADEYLRILEQGLVELETNSQDTELIQRLFRSAHTLKGCGRMMGFGDIADKAHIIEDVFGEIKENKTTFEKEVADKVFLLLDEIKQLVEKVSQDPSAQIQSNKPDVVPGDKTPAETTLTDTPKDSVDTTKDYLKVPLKRIDELLNLMGEIVVNKVKSSHKSDHLKKLCRQVKSSQKQLVQLKDLAKDAMGIPDEVLFHDGNIMHASAEFKQASEFFGRVHEIESDLSRLSEGLTTVLEDAQNEHFHLNPVIEDLQHKMKEIRMLPCSVVFDLFPRLIRDLSKDCEKEIDLKVIGHSTELDKKVLEAIKGPLVHILRNAIDHGLETPKERVENNKPQRGSIEVRAIQEKGRVTLEIKDDGRGLDVEKIRAKAISKQMIDANSAKEMTEREMLNLVFKPGFSTSAMITDISGRGVGLDVVRTEIEKLKGMVSITSVKGQGTTIRIELPLTIAVAEVLIVETANTQWAFPISNAARTMRISSECTTTLQNRQMLKVNDRWIPLIDLAKILGLSDGSRVENDTSEMTVMITQSLHKEAAVLIDRFVGQDEIFLKNLGTHLGNIRGIGGGAIMANGRVIIILDPQEIIRLAEGKTQQPLTANKKTQKKKKQILIVEDSLVTRELEKSILENNGYDVITAIDGIDGMEKCSRHEFDAIVSDIQMPRMDGFEFCRQIKTKEALKNIPFLFVTSLSKDEEKRRGLELGAQAYITKKQFDQGHLVDTLERLT